tara:strand:+ start:372 stop:536 length:165 start_codon:yes stop_codon:yes gene_type:complete
MKMHRKENIAREREREERESEREEKKEKEAAARSATGMVLPFREGGERCEARGS